MIKKIIPHIWLILPNKNAIMSNPIVEITKNGKSLLIKTLSTVKVPSNAETPITPKILNILLPITLPIEIPLLPANAALMEMAASGALVPNATIVNPTITAGIL